HASVPQPQWRSPSPVAPALTAITSAPAAMTPAAILYCALRTLLADLAAGVSGRLDCGSDDGGETSGPDSRGGSFRHSPPSGAATPSLGVSQDGGELQGEASPQAPLSSAPSSELRTVAVAEV
ncbi:unnamed protein product, partial [Phaeothamnion confervicola]